MKDFWKKTPTHFLSVTTLTLFATLTAPAQATTLTGFETDGGDMGGMQITVNLFDGTSQSAIWNATGGSSGGAFGSGWALTQSGNTFGSFDNPWNFSYSGGSSVAALIIDAIPGNTVFDIFPDVRGPRQTPGSADGWAFETDFGLGPSRHNYDVPIDISNGDLFGRLSLFWDGGFRGNMGFLADTDSGTTFDPVRPRNPVPPPPPPPVPPNTPPSLVGLNIPRIFEGQSATAFLSANDPNPQPLSFFLNGGFVGTDPRTTGTRSVATGLGFFADNGVHSYTAQAQDVTGAISNAIAQNLIVENVAPTLTNFSLSSNVINEGDLATAFLSATDPGADSLAFFLNGAHIATDGTLSGTRNATHNLGIFNDEGTFTFTAQSQDKDSAFSNLANQTLTVLNVAPTITQLTEPLRVKRHTLFDFFADATDPGINDLLSFDWDLNGDGLFDDFMGQSGQFSFAKPGLYDVKVRVSDGDGGVTVGSFTVESVPEPGTGLGLLVFGIVGTGAIAKHKRRKKLHN
ncbi:PKD domain-containing protein [Lusitaniella coriacea LEGE 07157]|uniref:PKD domain-containing protein n=1 Tax=Lusitaniella coriacea LEGE 07157 TaxID=945747 RepID=A0A8J7DL81_9CYAN|nr:PKD domain-containing protein [Lusitaniella coriacea]MBE9114383.1 PKD domain-containing protein [Lusitaniella coriacea LEGE 07157]